MNLLHNIIEATFNDQATPDYQLSLMAGGDSLVYFITDAERRVQALRAYGRSNTEKSVVQFLRQVLPQDNLLRHPFRQTHIAWFAPKFTLIPQAVWEEAQAGAYLKMVARVGGQEQVHYHPLPTPVAAYTVYALDGGIDQTVRQYFPTATQGHYLGGLLAQQLCHFAHADALVATAHLSADTWTITILHQQKLLYHNLFRYKNASDCLYYVLSVFKYLNINPQQHTLHLSGELVADSEIYQLLHKYIAHLSFVQRPAHYQYGVSYQKQIPDHFYLELLSQYLCE